jgi:colanic acid/amylovoran biosynthesis protein
MLDKTESSVSNNYYNFLLNVGKYLLKKGENLVILNHEGEEDLNICKQLSLDLGGVEIFNHWNPLVIKTAIGKVKLLISSRFHGCVSGLSQGVPVIATSWNHKYEMLLEEYNLRENVLSLRNPQIDFSLVDYALKGEKISIQQKESNKMKKKTELMWECVFSIIDGQ